MPSDPAANKKIDPAATKKSKRSIAKSEFQNQTSDDPWFDSKSGDFFSEDEFQFSEFDPSISYYPSPYCDVVEGMFLYFFTMMWLKVLTVFSYCDVM